jgi:diguanylate cyclase (GGDEF)-like protein/PAS domain S-box-containing protein
MFYRTNTKERRTAALIALAVLLAGMLVSFAVFRHQRQQQRSSFAEQRIEAARRYATLVQRQLDAYVAVNLSLAAFVSTSGGVDNQRLAAFVHAARHFERLKGISAFGYLPRVAPEMAGALETAVQDQLPGYHIRQRRLGADFFFPMLYLVDPDPNLAARVRGIDYSAYPERLAAIRRAEASGAPAASAVHASVVDPAKRPVVMTFTPVRTRERAYDRGVGSGVVVSIMRVAELFEGVDDGAGKSSFGLDVAEQEGQHLKPVYLSNFGANLGAGDEEPIHTGELRYADRSWKLRVFGKPGQDAAHGSWMVLAIGALCSLIAAYAAFLAARRHAVRRASGDMAERFASFFDAHPLSVFALDRDGRVVFANRKMSSELGMPSERLVGSPVAQCIPAAQRELAMARFSEALDGHAVACPAVFQDAQGQDADMALVLVPIMVGGTVGRILGFAENITERQRFERELYASRQLLRLILDTIPDRVFWKDRDSNFLGANRRMAEDAGLAGVEQIVGLSDAAMPWHRLAPSYQEEDREVMHSGMARMNIEIAQDNGDGSNSWFDVSKLPLTDDSGAVVGVLGVARDITRYKQMEAELVRRANYDSLTGLPNRAFFQSQLRQAVSRAGRREGVLALMYFDIDHFKQINDTYGHGVGDEVIRHFADRVCAVLRESDFVARLGGDEFVLILEDLPAPAMTRTLADKLIDAMRAPLCIGENTIGLSTSIGIAVLEDGMEADQLVKAADDAMYAAKRGGRNCYRTVPRSSGH